MIYVTPAMSVLLTTEVFPKMVFPVHLHYIRASQMKKVKVKVGYLL